MHHLTVAIVGLLAERGPLNIEQIRSALPARDAPFDALTALLELHHLGVVARDDNNRWSVPDEGADPEAPTDLLEHAATHSWSSRAASELLNHLGNVTEGNPRDIAAKLLFADENKRLPLHDVLHTSPDSFAASLRSLHGFSDLADGLKREGIIDDPSDIARCTPAQMFLVPGTSLGLIADIALATWCHTDVAPSQVATRTESPTCIVEVQLPSNVADRGLAQAYLLLIQRHLQLVAGAVGVEMAGAHGDAPRPSPELRMIELLASALGREDRLIVEERVLPPAGARRSQVELAQTLGMSQMQLAQLEYRLTQNIVRTVRSVTGGVDPLSPYVDDPNRPLPLTTVGWLLDQHWVTGEDVPLSMALLLFAFGRAVVREQVVPLPRSSGVGTPQPDEAVGFVLEVLSELGERDRTILVQRTYSKTPLTLEETGQIFKVTRERIRQLEKHATQQLETELEPYLLDFDLMEGEAIVDYHKLHHRLTHRFGNENGDVDVAVMILLRHANVERRGDLAAKHSTWQHLEIEIARAQRLGRTPLTMLRRRIEQVAPGISPEVLANLILEAGLHVSTDGIVEKPITTNLGRIMQLFEQRGVPLKPSEITSTLHMTKRQVSSVLQRKQHFAWVGNGIFAPASWGLDTYRGTEQALVDAIEARGGRAPIAEVIEEVTSRFGSATSSCQMYIGGSPRFIRDGKFVELADDTPRPVEPGNPERQARVYRRTDGGLTWGVDITREVLRGSGAYIPASVAARLGLLTNSELRMPAPGGDLRLYWNSQLPQISSLRPMANVFEARVGDRLLLHLPVADEPHWDLVRFDNAKECPERFAGRRAVESTDSLAELADACWGVEQWLIEEFLWDRKELGLLDALGFPHTDPRGRGIEPVALDDLCARAGMSRRKVADAAGLSPQALYATTDAEGLIPVTSRESSRVTRTLADALREESSVVTRRLFPRLGRDHEDPDLDEMELLF